MPDRSIETEEQLAAAYINRSGRQLRDFMTILGGVCPLSDRQLGLCASAAQQEYTTTVIRMGIVMYRLKRRMITPERR